MLSHVHVWPTLSRSCITSTPICTLNSSVMGSLLGLGSRGFCILGQSAPHLKRRTARSADSLALEMRIALNIAAVDACPKLVCTRFTASLSSRGRACHFLSRSSSARCHLSSSFSIALSLPRNFPKSTMYMTRSLAINGRIWADGDNCGYCSQSVLRMPPLSIKKLFRRGTLRGPRKGCGFRKRLAEADAQII